MRVNFSVNAKKNDTGEFVEDFTLDPRNNEAFQIEMAHNNNCSQPLNNHTIEISRIYYASNYEGMVVIEYPSLTIILKHRNFHA